MSDAQRKSSAVALGYVAIGSLSLVMRVALTSIKVATDLLLALNGARKQGNTGQSVIEGRNRGTLPRSASQAGAEEAMEDRHASGSIEKSIPQLSSSRE